MISYIFAHWFLILSVVLGTIGLVAFAWFAKNWKAALAAVVLVVAGLFYQSADMGGYKRALDEQKAAEIETLKHRLLTVSMISAQDTQRLQADQFILSKLEALSLDTPPNTSPCLDRAAAGRVRAIGGSDPFAAPAPSGRYSGLFQKRSARPR